MNKLEKLLLGVNVLIFALAMLFASKFSMLVSFLVGPIGLVILLILLISMIWGSVNSIRIFRAKQHRYKSMNPLIKSLQVIPIVNTAIFLIFANAIRILAG